MAGTKQHRGFGHIRKLASGRLQTSYIGPDLIRYYSAATFDDKGTAELWLGREQHLIALGEWTSPIVRNRNSKIVRPDTFGSFAEVWLQDRPLKPRTRSHYKALLKNQLEPWSDTLIKDIRPEMVRAWYTSLDSSKPTLKAHAYGLVRGILATAVEDELILANPCHIKGASRTKPAHKVEPATLLELERLVQAMPEQYKAMTLLASWCALRFGELVELRRKDIDLENGVIRIRRGAVRVNGEVLIGTPKSEAGLRDVAIPPHLIPSLRKHLSTSISGGKEGLLFPAVKGGTLHPTTLYTHFYKARVEAGRPDLRFHDLRHTGAVLAASTGATLAELMGRLGHSTPAAALRYQHAAQGRDQVIAEALSELAMGTGK